MTNDVNEEALAAQDCYHYVMWACGDDEFNLGFARSLAGKRASLNAALTHTRNGLPSACMSGFVKPSVDMRTRAGFLVVARAARDHVIAWGESNNVDVLTGKINEVAPVAPVSVIKPATDEMEYTITIGPGNNGALRVTVGRAGHPLAVDRQINKIENVPEYIARMLRSFCPCSTAENAALDAIVRKLSGGAP